MFSNSHHKYNSYLYHHLCCVCGQSECEDSSTHQKIELSDLLKIIEKKKIDSPQIHAKKQQLSKIYTEFKYRVGALIEEENQKMQIWLNQFFFIEKGASKFDVDFACEILQKDVSKFPSKKVHKLMRDMKRSPNATERQPFKDQLELIEQFENSFNPSEIFARLKQTFLSKEVKLLNLPKLSSKKTISQVSNPQQSEPISEIDKKVYTWRNIRVTCNSKTVSFSNKNISDREVMEQLPLVAPYKNLKELQIRNNKITNLTCNLIVNNLDFLHTIDIRGNSNIDDKGIIKLVVGFPKMRSFSISETKATDLSATQIAHKLPELQMLWSEHTQFSGEIAMSIAEKPKLKVLSLIGNPIEDEFKERMKKLFISKGYIAV